MSWLKHFILGEIYLIGGYEFSNNTTYSKQPQRCKSG